MGTFQKLADNWNSLTDAERIALFDQTTYETPVPGDLQSLSKVQFASYGPTNEDFKYQLTGVPADQVVKPDDLISTKSYEKIDVVNITTSTTGNAEIRIAVTNDGTIFKVFNFTTKIWDTLEITNKAAFLSTGIPFKSINTIAADEWAAVNTTGKIGFAYLLHIEAATETCSTDALVLTVDMQGTWNHAIHGTDYTYGYPNNELLQVDLLSNGDFKINYNAGEAKKE